ncbi:glycosyltransferase [Pseudoalteromonas luteoviolacea]|uniref:glycosyltransferase n=1 Tax=Pseudoalteromonas luteoviolacea TaxID=43657 RepID=UPI001F39AB9D|nr:glycosyltransferase [Pseudoalteromonas luteoviolacea]MCF6439070.1 glycosyltransferase [Pseudoalteromonas luteoviolacea]
MQNYQCFSVLCSIYRGEKAEYLNEAFESFHAQTLPATEIIVVHDGPLTDELYDALKMWKQKLPIKEVVLEQNVGLGEALNQGLKACSYELVARFDTDDINTPDRFEKQIEFMQNNPDVDLVTSNISEFQTEVGDISSFRTVPCSNNEIIKLAKYRNPINHVAVIFKKSAVLEVGSYKDLYFMEDYYLWIRMMGAGKQLASINESLVHVRIGNGMHKKRKGIKYAGSEYKLFKIKLKYGITGYLNGAFIFCLRLLPRLLPSSVLKVVYNRLRRKD